MKLFNMLFNINYISNIFNNKDIFVTINPTNNNNYFINFLELTLLSLPFIFRDGEICETDKDCPMKCCQIGNNKYCCTSNNYIKLEFSYVKNYIKSDI
jgi:hypothetical protein